MSRRKTTTDVRTIKLPRGLDERARREFRRIKPELIECGYTEIDQPALIAYLTHWSLWSQAREALETEGMIVTTPKGFSQVNPWHSVLKQNSELVKKYIQELGLSPGSRKRLGLKREREPTDDDLFGAEGEATDRRPAPGADDDEG